MPPLSKRRKIIRWSVYSALGLALAVVLVRPDSLVWASIGWMKFKGLFGASAVDLGPAKARLRAIAGADAALPLEGARVVVDKSDRKLGLYSGERLLKTYKIALGRHASGAKGKKSDGRTPTGDYFICTRNGLSQYHLFLGLSHPNAADADAGVKAGAIDDALRGKIADAEREGRQPPWDTPLGGAIGIHGGTSARDWTLGCVAVEDADVEEIWAATRIGTPVKIEE